MHFFQRLIWIWVVFGCLFQSCNHRSALSPVRATSDWIGTMYAEHAEVPFRFRQTDSSLIIMNGEELIPLTRVESIGDTTTYSFPHYVNSTIKTYPSGHQQLSGVWKYGAGNPVVISFTAQQSESAIETTKTTSYNRYFDVLFNPDSETRSTAVGAFHFGQSLSIGTFLTTTGDYRYLQGELEDSAFWLSTFDGSHLYLATGVINTTGSIDGEFYSGNNPAKTWVGHPTKHPLLPGADSITSLVADSSAFSFTVRNFQGDSVRFDSSDFKGNVSIVSIFGSWCPNCHDELRLHREIVERNKTRELQMIPVAFERDKSLKQAENSVNRVFSALGVPYDAYYGGKADKSEASRLFSVLDRVYAFPTTIIIGKNGKVRRIHTGFSGPGTGSVYIDYRANLIAFIDELLAE